MYFIGIDGGGSQTRALISNQAGIILGSGQSGPSNPLSNPSETCRQHIEEAIQQAFAARKYESPAAVHLGIAGAGSKKGHDILQAIGETIFDCSQTKLSISHDLEIALEGGLAGNPGLALVAGTGSACYGKNQSGVKVTSGGWGDLVDDAGSGSWIGLQALQACVQQEDGRLPISGLKDRILDQLDIDSMDLFKERIHCKGLTRTERARLAPIVFKSAALGDYAAIDITDRATTELCSLAYANYQKLQLDHPSIVLIGGLMEEPTFRNLLTAKLKKSVKDALVNRPKFTASAGAVFMALEALGIKNRHLTLHNNGEMLI